MTRTPLPSELVAVCARAQRACDEVAAALAALEGTRAQTEQVIAQARQIHPIGWCASADEGIVAPRTVADGDPYEAAYEAVDTILSHVTGHFPIALAHSAHVQKATGNS